MATAFLSAQLLAVACRGDAVSETMVSSHQEEDVVKPLNPPAGRKPKLVLRLESERTFQRNEAVIVRASIENVGPGVARVYHEMSPPTAKGRMRIDPLNYLRFTIHDEQGRLLTELGMPSAWDNVDNAFPQPSDIITLTPGDFFGSSINLTDGVFAHRFTSRGTFRVRARFESGARQWFEKARKNRTIDDRDPMTKILTGEVFGGILDSNEITIEVR